MSHFAACTTTVAAIMTGWPQRRILSDFRLQLSSRMLSIASPPVDFGFPQRWPARAFKAELAFLTEAMAPVGGHDFATAEAFELFQLMVQFVLALQFLTFELHMDTAHLYSPEIRGNRHGLIPLFTCPALIKARRSRMTALEGPKKGFPY
jgi:hypothetical protein